MNFHFGHPKYPGCLRFHHGTIRAKSYADQECYFEHPIKWWIGVSFARLFIGITRTDPTRDVREKGIAITATPPPPDSNTP